MNSHDTDWSEFTHTTQLSQVSTRELLEHYCDFQMLIGSLSKKELIARHWLNPDEDRASLSTLFFNLPLSNQATLFRKNTTADQDLLSVWQARAKRDAESIFIEKEISPFGGLSKHDLREIAQLSVDPTIVRDLPSRLAKFGVILIYIYALPGMKADGAVFQLSTGHPVIALSLRFPRLDYFWFTLLHELAHLVLHLDQLKEPVFFDVESIDDSDNIELAANRLAKESFVDRNSWRNCEPRYNTNECAVRTYAAQKGIHPAIVAGLLRKELGNFQRYNSLINEHDVRKIIFEP